MALKIKKKKAESEIFTGSMADIAFLLIIYFMITSAFSATRGLDFALPDDSQETPEIKQEDAVDVYVQPGGALQVDGKPIPFEGLLPYVGEKLRQNPDKPVILRTDPQATYGNMIAVFDELRRAPDKINLEIKTISIPTQREIENIWSMLGIAQ
jgi:biopolymer transport protein ExbD